MSVILDKQLPAFHILKSEYADVIALQEVYIGLTPKRLRIGVLNLMPTKVETETQLARVLSNSIIPVEIFWLKLNHYTPKNTKAEHMEMFYQKWSEIDIERLDALIITGAPVEQLSFTDVEYWTELCTFFKIAETKNAFFICWGAQAFLYYKYGIEKYIEQQKISGIFEHKITQTDSILRGLSDVTYIPVSRHTRVKEENITSFEELDVLIHSQEAGICLIKNNKLDHFYMFNHLEYDHDTILKEYIRDQERGHKTVIPSNYFSDDQKTLNKWRSFGFLMYGNWLNQLYKDKQYDPIRVGVAGLNTVGTNVLKLLKEREDFIKEKTGRQATIVAVSDLDKTRLHPKDALCYRWFDNPISLAEFDGIDMFIELIGTEKGISYDSVLTAIKNGKHVISSNQALFSHHGLELIIEAENRGLNTNFEAAIAGGIPIIKTMNEALASDRLLSIEAILNGPSNYILSQMEMTSRPFHEILHHAQNIECIAPESSLDVDGVDDAHKLNILSCIGFGYNIQVADMFVQGIRDITPLDMEIAQQQGYKIKLLARSFRTNDEICCAVSPYLINNSHDLACTDNQYNAILCKGESIGELFLKGRGSGGEPTATAVVAAVIDLAADRKSHPFGLPAQRIKSIKGYDIRNHIQRFYVRTTAEISIFSPYIETLLMQSDHHHIFLTIPLTLKKLHATLFSYTSMIIPLLEHEEDVGSTVTGMENTSNFPQII